MGSMTIFASGCKRVFPREGLAMEGKLMLLLFRGMAGSALDGCQRRFMRKVFPLKISMTGHTLH
jgi:hypothetical protein